MQKVQFSSKVEHLNNEVNETRDVTDRHAERLLHYKQAKVFEVKEELKKEEKEEKVKIETKEEKIIPKTKKVTRKAKTIKTNSIK